MAIPWPKEVHLKFQKGYKALIQARKFRELCLGAETKNSGMDIFAQNLTKIFSCCYH